MTPAERSGFIWMRGRVSACIWLGLLCVVVYGVGLTTLPTVDRDEARFAQASRQMVTSVASPDPDDPMLAGGLTLPMVQDRPRINKPPLIYWLQSASVFVFTGGDPQHDAIWMYRVPSVVAMLAAVLSVAVLGSRLVGRRSAALAAAMLAVAPVVVWEAHQARADAVLLVCVTAAQLCLGAVFISATRGARVGSGLVAGFWACVALGVLVKGPIAPMIALLTVLAASLLSGRWRWVMSLRPMIGVLVVLAAVLPWAHAVATHPLVGGWGAYLELILDETVGRSVSPKEGHSAPPGAHLVLLAALFWPGSLLTLSAVSLAISRVVRRIRSAPRANAEVFLVSWIVPSWIVFESVATKLPHYTMPLYPAIALLTARAAALAMSGRTYAPLAGATGRLGLIIWLVIGLALAAAPIALLVLRGSFDLGVATLASLVLIAAVALLARAFAAAWTSHSRLTLATVSSVYAACAVFVAFFIALPATPTPWVTTRLVEAIDAADPDAQASIASVGYHEDSLVFETRGRVVRLSDERATEWASRNPGGLLIVPAESPGASALGDELARIEGFNYSKGRRVELLLLRVDLLRVGQAP